MIVTAVLFKMVTLFKLSLNILFQNVSDIYFYTAFMVSEHVFSIFMMIMMFLVKTLTCLLFNLF